MVFDTGNQNMFREEFLGFYERHCMVIVKLDQTVLSTDHEMSPIIKNSKFE